MRAEDRNYYDILGVSSQASADEIRAAYKKLAVQYHPDKHSGNPLADLARERLAELNAAYSVLSDPQRRAEYDAMLVSRASAGGRPHARRYEAQGSLSALRRWRKVFLWVAALLVLPRILGPLARGLGLLGRGLVALVGRFGALASGSRLIIVVAVIAMVALAIYIRRRAR